MSDILARCPAVFLGRNGYKQDLERALEEFTPGETYFIVGGKQGQSHTSLEIEGHGSGWNSVMFEYDDLAAPIDSIFKSYHLPSRKEPMSATPTPRTDACIDEILAWDGSGEGPKSTADLARELEAELAAAADKRRLDWLEENLLSLFHDRRSSSISMDGSRLTARFVGEHRSIRRKTIREAIDASLAAETKPES